MRRPWGETARAIELTLDWVRQRKAFGASLWDKQAIRQQLAKRHAEVEALRAFIYQTAWGLGQGHRLVKEVSMIKALAGTLVNQVANYDCVQFRWRHGVHSRNRCPSAGGPRRGFKPLVAAPPGSCSKKSPNACKPCARTRRRTAVRYHWASDRRHQALTGTPTQPRPRPGQQAVG